MRSRSILASLVLSGALACGCGDAAVPAPAPPPEVEQSQDPPAVKEGIDLCFQALHGDLAIRDEAIAQLTSATEEHPDSARAFYFLGLCNLSVVAEGGSPSFAFAADDALSRAVELDPSNTRPLGFLHLIRLNKAIALQDEEGREQAIQDLIEATEIDFFNFFATALGLGQLPLDTGYPQKALEVLEEDVVYCNAPDAPRSCMNSEAAPHRQSGFYMQLADTHARLGNKAQAEEAYTAALTAPDVDTWRYAAEAEAWVSTLDERMALHADTDPSNDPEFFLGSTRACLGCHAD